MKKLISFFLKISVALLLLVMLAASASAQCAMCRATVENSISNGSGLAAGLNAGILYLASVPYLMLAGLAYFWYRHSRRQRMLNQGLSFRG
ncbi:MAG: hypothetical protein HC913_00230 [Microscillaceae bacterium]|nr:hypothetical protein [Microscillaceae bacterium]